MDTHRTESDSEVAVPGAVVEEIGAPAAAPIWELFSYRVLDAAGEPVGSVEQVWTDPVTGRPQFIGVRTGGFWKRTRVIPAGDKQIDARARALRVPYTWERIGGAPSHDSLVRLTSEQERTVEGYYDYH